MTKMKEIEEAGTCHMLAEAVNQHHTMASLEAVYLHSLWDTLYSCIQTQIKCIYPSVLKGLEGKFKVALSVTVSLETPQMFINKEWTVEHIHIVEYYITANAAGHGGMWRLLAPKSLMPGWVIQPDLVSKVPLLMHAADGHKANAIRGMTSQT